MVHRNLRTTRRKASQKWTISLEQQRKFKVGAVPADMARLFTTKKYSFCNYGRG
jgi:hypothetical protein